MPYTRLSYADFTRLRKANEASPRWHQLRKEKLYASHYECDVCGRGFLARYGTFQLQADHKRYWKNGELILGRETLADLRVLCPDHHMKGIRSDSTIRLEWAWHKVERLLVWLTKRVVRGLLWPVLPQRTP